MRSRPVRDVAARQTWALQHSHCQGCGLPGIEAARQVMGLTCHHIIKPGRSDEPCNFLLLCQRCHDLAELRTIRDTQGRALPTLPWPVCLTLKRYREPECFDLARCLELRQTGAIELPPIPAFLEAHYRARRPWDVKRHCPLIQEP